MTEAELTALADMIDACADDATRLTPYPGNIPNISVRADHRIVSLANGLRAISTTLRAHLLRKDQADG